MTGKKKELGLDRHGIQKTMRFSDYMADGFGNFGINMIMSLSGQVSYFYTEKAGVAAATVSAVLFVSKIIDAFTDLPAGWIFDKTDSPKGKCKPWFIALALPAFIVTVLLFTLPQGLDRTAQMAYMILTNVLVTAVFYTMVMVPYNAIVVMRTQSTEERSTIQIFRTIFGYISGAVCTMGVIPITNLLGGTQSAWIRFGVVVGLIGALSLVVVWMHCKEVITVSEEQKKKEENVPFLKGVGMLFRNRPWTICLLVGLVGQISSGLAQNTSGYYAKYIYGNDNLVAVTGGFGALAMLLGFILAKPLLKKFGFVNCVLLSSAANFLSCVVRMINPYFIQMNVAFACFAQLFGIAYYAAIGVMNNNNVEFNEEKYGVRLLGVASGVGGFITKVGNGVGISLATFILSLSGYNAALETQPASVTTGILTFSVYIPMVLNLVTFLLVLLYKPYEKKYYEMVAAKMAKKQGSTPDAGEPALQPEGEKA